MGETAVALSLLPGMGSRNPIKGHNPNLSGTDDADRLAFAVQDDAVFSHRRKWFIFQPVESTG